MIHFVSHIFDVRAEGVKLIAMEEVRNDGKFVYIKNIFEMAGGRMHILILANLLAIIYKNHHKSLAILYLLSTINFVLFYQKTESNKGGMAQWPP